MKVCHLRSNETPNRLYGAYMYFKSGKQYRLAKSMRQEPTNAEKLMWDRLRAKRLAGHKFRRQMPIDRFIVDFACFESKLVVELDGGQHAEQARYDEFRTSVINRKGYRVLRFWNSEVFENMEGVLATILANLEE